MARLRHAAQYALLVSALMLAACGGTHPEPASQDVTSEVTAAAACPGTTDGVRKVYWGDLHAHTAYSLDAYGFGTVKTPADAYRFAKGEPLELFSETYQIDRPLDFLAVTDHAEWLDFMYTCTEPLQSNHPTCKKLRAQSGRETGGTIFRDFVNPTITEETPAQTQVCKDNPEACAQAVLSQWDRVQAQANAANQPCDFTAFIGFEWSATPNYSHTHRNVIYASDAVSPSPIDYIRYPKLEQLWENLESSCRPEDGCEAITIAHNMNLGDGKSFDIETDNDRKNDLRRRYEPLVEVMQEKGASECLSPFSSDESSDDCGFELYVTRQSRLAKKTDYTEEQWERMRGSYARSLLARGTVFEATGKGRNPLQVGLIGSTDSHTGLAGMVDEAAWPGGAFGIGDLDTMMGRIGFNPGGLVAIWAEENTRASLFAAMKERQVYATSGPRILLKLDAAADTDLTCKSGGALYPYRDGVPMGSQISEPAAKLNFRISVNADQTPLTSLEIIKGAVTGGVYEENIVTVWNSEAGEQDICVSWSDPAFDPSAHAFWYARVKQVPTPRWSSVKCLAEDRCDEFPGADVAVQERAWSSPIWYNPDNE